ncbi:MAG: DNA-directed RNA polymerase subunit alpha [Thermodesulfovibrionia bacterium]|nr:DNA-directed RNA polymerase subunit alpha [Thermodesulfovibrionia bacterium]
MEFKKRGFNIPERVVFDSGSDHKYGKLIAEPFERGYGTTVGNALRRVLLSSIEGAAVTSVKIPGVLHEFSTLQGLKEDVVDLILNIKQLRFKMHSDEPKVVTIEISGPGEVKGRDIITDADVEVLTPDQHIATLDKKMKFTAELKIEKGTGYRVPDEVHGEDETVDMIKVDSIFTPVRKVNFWIEGARVGRSTDFDKLIMEIWTDGSITPQEALSQAANILNEHISLFSMDEEVKKEVIDTDAYADDIVPDEEDDDSSFEEMDEEEEPSSLSVFNDNLLKSVDELELSVRSNNCLKNANIFTIADLVQRTESEMLRTKNFGRKSLNEIKEVVLKMGLHFNMRIEPDVLKKLEKARGVKHAS